MGLRGIAPHHLPGQRDGHGRTVLDEFSRQCSRFIEKLFGRVTGDYWRNDMPTRSLNNGVIGFEPEFRAERKRWGIGLGVNLSLDINDTTTKVLVSRDLGSGSGNARSSTSNKAAPNNAGINFDTIFNVFIFISPVGSGITNSGLFCMMQA